MHAHANHATLTHADVTSCMHQPTCTNYTRRLYLTNDYPAKIDQSVETKLQYQIKYYC